MTDLRKYYIKLTFVYYILWVILFLAVGWYANELPIFDFTLKIDDAIPVIPQFVWFYLLCFIFPFLLLFITRNWHRYNIALLSVTFCTIIAFIVHLLFPVTFIKPALNSGFSEQVLAFIYRHDFNPGAENLPSLHVSFAMIVYFASRHQNLKKTIEVLILMISILIILSTLFVKQHLFVDVMAGILLTALVWYGIQLFYQKYVIHESDPVKTLKTAIKELRLIFVLSGGVLITIVLLKLLFTSF